MRITQVQNSYLYEGLDRSTSNSMFLWETAGIKLREAALTADQIQQIFQNIEQGATASGSNRTLLGKGKDAAVAVDQAWEDLKTKIQNSRPIKNFDDAYDATVAKIEAGLGGPDNAINKVIQKYRTFAKEHPIAQGFIYSALIAAAGISGAGLGGAAVLGLLKMADKLLQGEKFSSAAYSGAKTGAMAYGASKIGDMIKGKPEATPGAGGDSDYASQMRAQGIDPNDPDGTLRLGMKGNSAPDAAGSAAPTTAASGSDAAGNAASSAGDASTTVSTAAKGASKTVSQDMIAQAADRYPELNPIQQKIAAMIDAGQPLNQNQMDFLQKATDVAARKASMMGDMPDGSANAGMRQFMSLDKLLARAKTESYEYQSRPLSEGQIYMIFNRIVREDVMEGPLDMIKGAVAKGKDKLQTFGKNLTTKITADKLNKMWQGAGAPTDSQELYTLLTTKGGVSAEILDKVYKDLKIKNAGSNQAATPKAQTAYAQVKDSIPQLNTKQKKQLMAMLQTQLGTA